MRDGGKTHLQSQQICSTESGKICARKRKDQGEESFIRKIAFLSENYGTRAQEATAWAKDHHAEGGLRRGGGEKSRGSTDFRQKGSNSTAGLNGQNIKRDWEGKKSSKEDKRPTRNFH